MFSSFEVTQKGIEPGALLQILKNSESCTVSRIGVLKALGLRKTRCALDQLSQTINELELAGKVEKLGAHSVRFSQPANVKKTKCVEKNTSLQPRLLQVLEQIESQKLSRVGALKALGMQKTRTSLDQLAEAINALQLEGSVQKLGGHSVCLAGDAGKRKREQKQYDTDVEDEEIKEVNKKQKQEQEQESAKDRVFNVHDIRELICRYAGIRNQRQWVQLRSLNKDWQRFCLLPRCAKLVQFKIPENFAPEQWSSLPDVLENLDMENHERFDNADDRKRVFTELHKKVHLRNLNMRYCSVSIAELKQLSTDYLPKLEELDVSDFHVGSRRNRYGTLQEAFEKFTSLTSLNISHWRYFQNGEGEWNGLKLLQNLKRLDLTGCTVNDGNLKSMTALNLQELKLSCYEGVTVNGLNSFFDPEFRTSPFQLKLKSLTLTSETKDSAEWNDEDLKTLFQHVNPSELNNLELTGFREAQNLESLAKFTKLKRLALNDFHGATDAGLNTVLQNLIQLEHLGLSACDKISIVGLRNLILAKDTLMSLKLSHFNGMEDPQNGETTQEMVQTLKDVIPELTNLVDLDLSNSWHFIRQLYSNEVRFPSGIQKLNLSYGWGTILPQIYVYFSTQLLTLKELDISNSNIENYNIDSITVLSEFKELEHLNMNDNHNFDGTGLEQVLGSLTKLKSLSLVNNRFIPMSTMNLCMTALPENLQILNLSGTYVSNEGLQSIAASHLQVLELLRCRLITIENIKQIQKKFPMCVVKYRLLR
jgi:hypothetical protein